MKFLGYNREMTALNAPWKFGKIVKIHARDGIMYLSVLLLTIKTSQWLDDFLF